MQLGPMWEPVGEAVGQNSDRSALLTTLYPACSAAATLAACLAAVLGGAGACAAHPATVTALITRANRTVPPQIGRLQMTMPLGADKTQASSVSARGSIELVGRVVDSNLHDQEIKSLLLYQLSLTALS